MPGQAKNGSERLFFLQKRPIDQCMNKTFLVYFIFVLVGCRLMSRTWNGLVYVDLGEKRSPAAVKALADLYPVNGRVLHEALNDQFFQNMEFLKRPNEPGIRLGHFLTRDVDGRRLFACQAQSRSGLYDRVELSFIGIGVSDSGVIPKMTVESICESEDDLAVINPIWIPMADIYQSEPKAQDLRFPELKKTSIHFEDLASAWPERWKLLRVRFYQSASSLPGLIVEPNPQQAVTFDWK
jgi:hypothetical protein